MKEKMKELSGIGARVDIFRALLVQLLFLLCGFSAAGGRMAGDVMPFGAAVIGGSPSGYIITSAAGAVIRVLFFGGEMSFRYLASAIALAAIKKLSASAVKGELRPAFCALITALVVGATGIITVAERVEDIVLSASETVAAAAGAYFLSVAAIGIKKQLSGLSFEEISGLLISVAAVCSGLFSINAGALNIGRIAAGIAVMLTARYAVLGCSAVCGVALGAVALMNSADNSVLLLMCLGGVLAGVFSRLGKYAIIAAYIISVFFACAVTDSFSAVSYVLEAMLASGIFLILPKSLTMPLGKLLSPKPLVEAPVSLKKSVTMRLQFAANALGDVSDTVEQVSRELAKINSPEFGDVFSGVELEACCGCPMRLHCWEAKRDSTVSAVIEMTKAVKRGDIQPENSAGEEFMGRCVRLSAMGNAVYKNYSEYAASLAAESRIEEVRGVVSDQFCGISDMLTDLSTEIENGENYDNVAAERVLTALKDIDIIADGCCCRIDKYGRMNVEIRLSSHADTVVNRMQIMRQAQLACERDFDPPVVTVLSTQTLINLNEKAALSADIGVNQISRGGKTMCGDSYKYFLDGRGKAIMVLSDGMGTGGRAAVDSAMASGLMSRLIRAGFGYDCSLRILNSSMIFKSTDESLATVDIAVIDLFTGRTDLFKAGAAPTLVRRNGRTGKAQSTSLPAGILRDVAFDKATFRLKKGDILLLLSDGATADGTDWICAELEKWSEGSAQQLSEHLSRCAKRRRNDEHDDDISVMALILDKAV